MMASCPKGSMRANSWEVQVLTWSSSMVEPHLSRSILLMATFMLFFKQRATWTTAVAPLPAVIGIYMHYCAHKYEGIIRTFWRPHVQDNESTVYSGKFQ